MRVDIWTDGAAAPTNPGPAGAGYVIVADGGQGWLGSVPLDEETSSTKAEYTAVRMALEVALASGATRAVVWMDARPVCKQLRRKHRPKGSSEWKCKSDDLLRLRGDIWGLVGRFPDKDVKFEWIPRNRNGVADALASAAASIASTEKKTARGS